MNVDNYFQAVTLLTIVAGILIGLIQYGYQRRLAKYDLFIKYRDKLKTNESTLKIITHIQDWQNKPDDKNKIDSRGILLKDFYYFLGFFEEISLLNQEGLISDKLVNEMFGFYAREIANNSYYWEKFGEDFNNDDDWENFKKLIDKVRIKKQSITSAPM